MLSRRKWTSVIQRQWKALNLNDKIQLVFLVTASCWGAYAVSPELEALHRILTQLPPAVEQADSLYVQQALRDGERIDVRLRKVRTTESMRYEVWMCEGPQDRKLIFFGSGYLGKEDNDVVLSNYLSSNPSRLILNTTLENQEFGKVESWDLIRGVREEATIVSEGKAQCGGA